MLSLSMVGGCCSRFMLGVGDQEAELHRENLQGVVFEGTPEREEKQERVRTGSARSAGKPTLQSINRLLSLFLSLKFREHGFKMSSFV